MSLFRILALGAGALSLSACATVTRGTKDAWEVSSDPSGARVQTSHGHFCEATPCAMKMPRKSEFTATVTKPGYKPATISVTNKVAGSGGAAMAGNVLVGGIIGAGVDVSTGAMLDLVPNPAFVKLEPETPPAVQPAAAPAAVAPAPATTPTSAAPAGS